MTKLLVVNINLDPTMLEGCGAIATAQASPPQSIAVEEATNADERETKLRRKISQSRMKAAAPQSKRSA